LRGVRQARGGTPQTKRFRNREVTGARTPEDVKGCQKSIKKNINKSWGPLGSVTKRAPGRKQAKEDAGTTSKKLTGGRPTFTGKLKSGGERGNQRDLRGSKIVGKHKTQASHLCMGENVYDRLQGGARFS